MEPQRSIVVTGASSGIGAYCARALGAEGWRVFATARKPGDIAALEAAGLEGLYLDYREPESIAALAKKVLERTGGRLDALYNNGAHMQVGAVEDLPAAALREQFEANLFGWHELTRCFLPAMRAAGSGRIVNCSSILGMMPAPYRGAYVASKYALEGLTLCLRLELEGSGIHVSLIEPGPIETRFDANGLAFFERDIETRHSPNAAGYERQVARLKAGGRQTRFRLKPEAVYAALRHALLHPRPRPHYVITSPARIGAVLKRILPARAFYRLVSSRL